MLALCEAASEESLSTHLGPEKRVFTENGCQIERLVRSAVLVIDVLAFSRRVWDLGPFLRG